MTAEHRQARPAESTRGRETSNVRSYGDSPTTPGRSRNMQAIRRTNTKPEIELRSALHRRGYRFRKDLSIYTSTRRVRPDIVFTARKVAVFVDGCFWHCCPVHGRRPTANTGYWSPKLQRNVERDKLADTALRDDGWRVIRIWEHEHLDEAISKVVSALDRSRA
jgi:DNA mismatch endonuclease (patch repair protein)